MTESKAFGPPQFYDEMFEPSNLRFLFRTLQQTTLRGFEGKDFRSGAAMGKAITNQLQTLNSPFVWDSVLTLYKPQDTRSLTEISAQNQPFMDDITLVAMDGIIWGAEELYEEKYKSTPMKKAIFQAVAHMTGAASALDEIIARTEQVIGNPGRTGSLYKSLTNDTNIELTSDHTTLLNMMRIYGRGFAPQLQVNA